MTIRIDPQKCNPNVTTRDGFPVMLFAYMSKQQRAYLGIYYNKDTWVACSWLKDGSYLGTGAKCGLDLIELVDLLENKEAQ